MTNYDKYLLDIVEPLDNHANPNCEYCHGEGVIRGFKGRPEVCDCVKLNIKIDNDE